ncbi:MAG TPA: hypothetical protein VGN23_09275 [Verrucomicrobiae bacterium]
MKPSSTAPSGKAKIHAFLTIAALLAIVLCVLFYQNFESGMVLFSNDGPLGQIMATQDHMPAGFTGCWQDLFSIGANAGSATPSVTTAIKSFWEVLFRELGPLGYLNTYTPIGLYIMGLGAWAFFRKLKLSPLAATLGALAVMLNAELFSGACWGVASDQIALGFNFLALALVVANDDEPAPVIFWTRYALAGLCVGVNVMEAADVGALCSMFVALYILFKSLVDDDSPMAAKIGRAIPRIAVVAVLAGFIACQTVFSLIGTQLQGTSLSQSDKNSLQQWDYATQWSLPKQETLGLFVPGLFGYRMDTPLNTVPFLQGLYAGGMYWGGMGRDPANDRYFDSGGKDSPPDPTYMRFGYGGYYCGILVALLAFWTVAQSFRKDKSPFTGVQKKFIWFWSIIIVLSLLLAWGRFAHVFYGFLYYHVPYFSSMRNPGKFMFFIEWGLTVLFAYGVYGLQQRHLSETAAVKTDVKDEDKFDQRSLYVGAGLFAVSVIGWFVFASNRAGFIQYLKYRGFGDNETAKEIASFSISQGGWFLLIFAIALVLLAAIINNYLAGPRAKWAAALLGLFLVFDLGRADLPFIVHWDIKQKYEVGDLNPVIDYLRPQPYEHRVAILPQPPSGPFNFPPECGIMSELYGIEWSQHLLPYYNIQSLDIVQMPRMPLDLMAYQQAFFPQAESEAFFYARWWQLSNTRYLLGPAVYVDSMNAQLDPGQQRFRTVMRFGIGLKPGIQQYNGDSSELTAYLDTNGPDALIEFTGALPRVKLYTDWQTNSDAELKSFSTNNLSPMDSIMFGEAGTNGLITLKKLESPFFNPEKTVLIDTPPPGSNPPPSVADTDAGTVDFASYAPKHIVLDVNAAAPAVLLLNDHYDPNWHVTLDGQPTRLFHANFIMQGIFVPAGKHTVDYQFSMPNKPLCVTVAAIILGLGLCGVMIFYKRPVVEKPRNKLFGK